MRALIVLLTVAALAEAAVFGFRARATIAEWWHAPAGDGVQYYSLASNLVAHHVLAYGDLRPTWTRPPLYPLFLARVVDRTLQPLEEHLVRATRWNARLDVCTALLVWLIAWRRRVVVAGWLALVGVLACPLLILLSTYALSESLATLLTTAVILFAVLALEGAAVRWAIAAGLVGGALMLIRADGVTVIPPVVLALWLARASRRRRLTAIVAFGVAWAAAIAPWGIRNVRLFGEPHLLGAKWLAKDGTPMRTGPEEWMWTWERHASAGLMNLRMLSRTHLDLTLMPAEVIHDDQERRAVEHALDDCNAAGVSADVAREFRALSVERRRRYPFEVYVKTPLGRMKDLWMDTIQEGDMPLGVAPFGLGERALFTRFDHRLYLLALAGLLLALIPGAGRRHAKLAAIIALAALTRTAVDGATQAHVTQRYLVEIYPLVILLAAMAPALAAERALALGRRLRGR